MNHHNLTEEEDINFQQGREFALLLDRYPCVQDDCEGKSTRCPDCIAAVVEAVENAFRDDAEKNAAELEKVIGLRKKWPTEII